MKAITFSYDDGVTQDIRLIELFNKYGLKGTFNLNSEFLGGFNSLVRDGRTVTHNKNKAEDVRHIYDGHEVAVHTLTHPFLPDIEDDNEIIRQVEQDRLNLSALVGYEVVGVAYPCGGKDFYHRQPTESDIRWMSYTALAYGATGIEEFVYTSVGTGAEFDADDHGAIWWDNQGDLSTYYRTDVWYSAQKVHQELFEFDHVLLSFDWKGVLCHNVTNDPNVTPVFENAVGKLENHKRIEKIDSTGDLLIGCFEDANQYDGFLVVNFTETAHNSHLRNTASVTFDYATKALVYVKGEQQLVELTDHTYSCTLLPGEAFFIIPVA